MAESVELVAQKREGLGTRASRRIRTEGKIPGVVYGHKQETISITLENEDLVQAIKHGARLVDLKLGGATETALISEVQWDFLGKDLIHVDFRRVSKDERIHVPVRVELRGIAPGVTGGGVLDQPLHELEIECLAVAVPESIRVSIAELQLGQAIHVKDLTLPEGAKALNEADAIVVQVKQPEAEPEPGTEGAPAGPEVIGRKEEEGEGEEKK
jgi:large subunit ribosomal protein L25